MQKPYVGSFTEVAEELGVERRLIGEMVRMLGIEPKPIRRGRAKGLDAADVELLRERLRPVGTAGD